MIAVTGADSILGERVFELLREQGREVRALTDPDSFDKDLAGCSCVYHCLEHFDVTNRSQIFYDVNVTAVEKLMQAAANAGVKRVLHVSSVAAAGPVQHYRKRTEADSPEPLPGPYPETKSMGEETAVRIAAETGLELVIVRPSFLVGKGAEITARCFAAFANSRLRLIPGNRNHAYNFIGVDDCAAGCILAMEKGRNNEVYLLTGDEHLTLEHTLTLFSELSGLPPARNLSLPLFVMVTAIHLRNSLPGGGQEELMTGEFVENYLTWNWIFSNEKAKEELGFSPAPIEDAWRNAISWAAESGWVRPPAAEKVKHCISDA